jgi:hypothetical protein
VAACALDAAHWVTGGSITNSDRALDAGAGLGHQTAEVAAGRQLKERRTSAGWRDRHWPRAYTTRLAFPGGIGEALGLISC